MTMLMPWTASCEGVPGFHALIAVTAAAVSVVSLAERDGFPSMDATEAAALPSTEVRAAKVDCVGQPIRGSKAAAEPVTRKVRRFIESP
jgi:hypothetical protein